jgi:hypothetical protein
MCTAMVCSATVLLSTGSARAASHWSCIRTDNGSENPGPACGPYLDRAISGSDGDNTLVLNDMWNPPGAGHRQTIRVDNPSDWEVTSDQAKGNTAVLSYPDVQEILTTTQDRPAPLSGFASITGRFDESMPFNGDNEAAFDIWMGGSKSSNYAQEVMIWTDDHRTNPPPGSVVARVHFGGAGYAVWQDPTDGGAGFHTIYMVRERNEKDGTVRIGTMLDWLVAHHLSAAIGINQIDYGWEICSTDGRPETFILHHYFLDVKCRGGGARCYS